MMTFLLILDLLYWNNRDPGIQDPRTAITNPQHITRLNTSKQNAKLELSSKACTHTYVHAAHPAAVADKLSYRRGTAQCVVSIEILPTATQQCRNYLYDKSWPNRWYEVGDLVRGNAW